MAYGFADSGDINAQRNALALALMQQGISTPGSSLSFQDPISSDPAASDMAGGSVLGGSPSQAQAEAAAASALGSLDATGMSSQGGFTSLSNAAPSNFGDLVGSNNSAINTGGMTIGQPGFTVADAPTASAPAQTGLTSFSTDPGAISLGNSPVASGKFGGANNTGSIANPGYELDFSTDQSATPGQMANGLMGLTGLVGQGIFGGAGLIGQGYGNALSGLSGLFGTGFQQGAPSQGIVGPVAGPNLGGGRSISSSGFESDPGFNQAVEQAAQAALDAAAAQGQSTDTGGGMFGSGPAGAMAAQGGLTGMGFEGGSALGQGFGGMFGGGPDVGGGGPTGGGAVTGAAGEAGMGGIGMDPGGGFEGGGPGGTSVGGDAAGPGGAGDDD